MKNTEIFQLVEAFSLAKGTASEDAAYSNMIAEIMIEKQSHYGCYNMLLFVILFKYARTQKLRDYAIQNMGNILDGYLTDDEIYDEFEKLIDLFKEDECYKLNECIISSIINIIQQFVDYFTSREKLLKKQLNYSVYMAGAGQSDFLPEYPVNIAIQNYQNSKIFLDKADVILKKAISLKESLGITRHRLFNSKKELILIKAEILFQLFLLKKKNNIKLFSFEIKYPNF